MKLQQLLSDLEIKDPQKIPDITVTDIAYDSRKVTPGALFVAISGLTTDGHQFISEAMDRGAVAVVGEKEQISNSFLVPNSRIALAKLSAKFFGEPTRDLKVIGVTGTNGKTTITYLVETFLQAAGGSPAVLGTINYRHGKKIDSASHTTPESYDLQNFIHQVKSEGCDSVVMEVSSHALDLHRVDEIHYDVCVFTNLTPEHLDYHHTLEDYFQAKGRLFEELLEKSCKQQRAAIINLDDPFAPRLSSKISRSKILTFSLDPKKGADLFPISSDFSLKGTAAEIQTPWGKTKIKSPLLGAFNLSNLLASIGAVGVLGVPLSVIQKETENFRGVPGRLERAPVDRGIHVFVDYAHTPDALRNVIGSLRGLLKEESGGRILVVFGCGGDRDKSKRPLMGKEVAKWADWGVVTSDNPRTEDPQAIINEILPGLTSQGWKEGKKFVIEPDRAQAIRLALESAHEGDIVLIAGKGHEDYQIIGKNKIHFDDREVVKELSM
jgi:UDP-N-acetylmuramoyl-L-alanyl-D-glutamate--2,6-diaminopimelate ligase